MHFKNKEIKLMLKSVLDKNYLAKNTLISIDDDKGIIVDGFKELIDFTDKTLNLLARDKNIYIYGDNLIITSFKKSSLYISGEISKIEFYEVK